VKLIPVLMILTGALLIFSAKQKQDPRNVIFQALGIKRRVDSTGLGGTDLGTGTFKAVPNPAATPSNYTTTTPGVTVVSV
jgi:hypothetical protein